MINAKTKIAIENTSYLTISFLLGFFLWLWVNNGNYQNLKQLLNEEKLKTEKILSEKMLIEKDLSITKQLLTQSQNEYNLINETLDQANKNIEEQSAIVSKSKKTINDCAALKKQVTELKSSNELLTQQKKEISDELTEAKNENKTLNNLVVSLQNDTKVLQENIAMMSWMNVNNVLVETTNGKKERLTVKARRTQKIQVTFDLPEELSDNVSFKVTSPTGKIFTNTKKSIQLSINNNTNEEVFAGLNGGSSATAIKTKRIKMICFPEEKLSKGIYNIEILNKNKTAGNIKVNLR